MITDVPYFISAAFVLAILFPIFLIARMAKSNMNNQIQANRTFIGIVTFYFIYLAIVSFASLNGFFEEAMLPPKIVRFTTIPLLIFLIGFVFNTNLLKQILEKVELSSLIKLHIFRLIGSFFLILLFFETLPKPFALIAGIGDITTAVSSLFVAMAVQKNKSYARGLAIIWNTFGLLDILVTSAMAIGFTKLNMETGALGVDILGTFPFCFIPAFAPATIIFLHLCIYRKIFSKNFQS